MTLPLRQLHRRVFHWLTLLLPALFVLGLLGYRLPVHTEIPDPQLLSMPANAESEGVARPLEEGDFERESPIRVEVFREPASGSGGAQRRWARVTATGDLRQPDLLVYWSSKSSTFEEPPIGAFLLGVLDPRTPQDFPLPSQADFLRGYLVIYSLGQKVLIAQVLLPQPF